MLLLHGFIAEQAYLLLWLSKAVFLSERPLSNIKKWHFIFIINFNFPVINSFWKMLKIDRG